MASTTAAQTPPTVVTWLDAYAAGRFDHVVSGLQRTDDVDGILDQLKRDV